MELLWAIITGIFCFACIKTIVVACHEIGHALAALLVYRQNIHVHIGNNGNPRRGIHFSLGKITVHCSLNLFNWDSGVTYASKVGIPGRWKAVVFLSAGPLVSLSLSLAAVYWICQPANGASGKTAAWFLLLASAVDFIQNMHPRMKEKNLFDGTLAMSDGFYLKNNIFLSVADIRFDLDSYYRLGQYSKGVRYYEWTRKKKKKTPLLMSAAVPLYIQLKKYKKALELLEELKSRNRMKATDYANYGVIETRSGNFAEAEKYYNQALEMDGDQGLFYNNRGYNFFLQNDYQKAAVDFNMSLIHDSNCSQAYTNRAKLKLATGLTDEAKKDIDMALELDDRSAHLFATLGLYYTEKKELALASEQFSKARQIDPEADGLLPVIGFLF